MKFIEIEKKVRLEPHQIEKIGRKASLLKEARIHDRYFDTSDYRFTTQNMWLRQRGEVFELKVGIKMDNGSIDRYEEITNEKSILEYLGADIVLNQLSPFCSCITHRKSYQLGELKIDIDKADFGDLHYHVAEIEMIVSDLEKIQETEQKIFQFIKEMEIDISVPVPAKLTYYLYCKKPDHYKGLVQHNVIQPIIN